MRGGSRKGRTPNRSRRGCREIGGVERGALESPERASLEFWGCGRREHEGVVRGGPWGGEWHVEGAGGCLEGGK